MAKAFSTSEANARLIELGYAINNRSNMIGDTPFTAEFGTSDYYYKEKESEFGFGRIIEIIGTGFSLDINEWGNGKSYLGISKHTGHSGRTIINYKKLCASDKKKFMEFFENLASTRRTFMLKNWEHVVYGNYTPAIYLL